MATELLYLRDAYLREFTATVLDRRDGAVALDRTAFYPTGGGQPHDTGSLGGLAVVDVRKEGDLVWHTVDGDAPDAGTDGDRRGGLGSAARARCAPTPRSTCCAASSGTSGGSR